MKRTPLKRKSKTDYRKLTDKADRALQDWFRKTYPNKKCEICGRKFDVMHHFFPKSMSRNLRYNPLNLIFICNGCHNQHHRQGNPAIHATVIQKRGIEWYEELEELKRITVQFNKKTLQSIIEQYDI